MLLVSTAVRVAKLSFEFAMSWEFSGRNISSRGGSDSTSSNGERPIRGWTGLLYANARISAYRDHVLVCSETNARRPANNVMLNCSHCPLVCG